MSFTYSRIYFIQKLFNLMNVKDVNNAESKNKISCSDSDEIAKLKEQIKRQTYLISHQDKRINELNFMVKKLEGKNKELIDALDD